MKRLLALVAAVALSIMSIGPAAASNGTGASGSAQGESVEGSGVSFNMSAHVGNQSGQVHFGNEFGGYLNGTIDCARMLDEHTIVFSGYTTKTNEPAWTHFIGWVHEGTDSTDAYWRLSAGADRSCNDSSADVAPPDRYTVAKGKLVVRS